MKTGKTLWETRLGTSVQGFPVSFSVGGKQYIAVHDRPGRREPARGAADDRAGDHVTRIAATRCTSSRWPTDRSLRDVRPDAGARASPALLKGWRDFQRAVRTDILHLHARVVVTPADAPIVLEELSGGREQADRPPPAAALRPPASAPRPVRKLGRWGYAASR